MKKLWFRAKYWGWGWYPVSWEGWLTILAFVALMIGNAFRLHVSHTNHVHLGEFLVETAILVVILITICWWKGERLGWRWGRPTEDK